jgi:hypothetical protein
MARHVWSVLAQMILVDQFTNAVSFIQIVEGFTVSALPAIAPQMMLGTLWSRQGEETTVHSRVRVIAPDGSEALALENRPPSLVEAKARTITHLGGYQLTLPGSYQVLVEQRLADRWETAATIPFDVTVVSSADLVALLEKRATALSSPRSR